MRQNTRSKPINGPHETDELARKLATHLGAGDVLLLDGDVGAGKTHFARALILSLLAEAEDIPSPTFTLVQSYEAPEFEIWHADLYRLTDVQEIEELGLTEAFDTALCLIEWPDRLADLAPSGALHLQFAPGADPDQRNLIAHWSDPRWTPIVEAAL